MANSSFISRSLKATAQATQTTQIDNGRKTQSDISLRGYKDAKYEHEKVFRMITH